MLAVRSVKASEKQALQGFPGASSRKSSARIDQKTARNDGIQRPTLFRAFHGRNALAILTPHFFCRTEVHHSTRSSSVTEIRCRGSKISGDVKAVVVVPLAPGSRMPEKSTKANRRTTVTAAANH